MQKTFVQEPARVSLVPRPASVACELCTSDATAASMTLVIQHARGGLVELSVCDWCVYALRRLSAATGGSAVFAVSEVSAPFPTLMHSTPRGERPAAPAVLIQELTQRVQDSTGTEYVVQVYGRARSDGTWEGWLEFVARGTGTVLRTARETTQSKYEDVVYWASGLEPSYIIGAFERAVRERAAR